MLFTQMFDRMWTPSMLGVNLALRYIMSRANRHQMCRTEARSCSSTAFHKRGTSFAGSSLQVSNASYHVIVPDYRGAGDSTKPSQEQAVFTEAVMAEDLHLLLTQNLKITEKVHIVGESARCIQPKRRLTIFNTSCACNWSSTLESSNTCYYK